MKSTGVDTSQYFSLQIRTLKLCGMWFYIQYPLKSFRFWLSIVTKIFIGLTIFIIPTGSQLLYVIKLIVIGEAEIQEIAGVMNLAITELQVYLRLLDLFLRRQSFMRLVGQLSVNDFKFRLKPQNDIINNATILSKKLFWALFIACAVDIIVQAIMVPGLHNFEVLPLKMNLIWIDINDEKYFKLIFAYQILYKPIVLSTFIALQTLTWAAMMFINSQLDVLIYNLENIEGLVNDFSSENNCDRNTAYKEVFKRCILHHCSIISFINTLQDTFSGQFSVTMCLNAGIICTTVVQILSIESPAKNITNVAWILVFLSVFIGNIFIDCYFSNAVTTKSFHVSTVVYSCPWTDLPITFKKNLLLFIARTQRPVVITAAKFVPVSLETFTKIMNWTYKGAALMNQMKK